MDLHNVVRSIFLNCKEGKNRSVLMVVAILCAIHWRDNYEPQVLMEYMCKVHPNAEFAQQYAYSKDPQVLCVGTHM